MDYRIGVNKLLSNTFFIAIVLVLFRGQTKLIYITNEVLLMTALLFGIFFFQNKVRLKKIVWQKEILFFFLWGVLSYIWSSYGATEKEYYFVFLSMIFILMIRIEEDFWNKLMKWTIVFSNIIACSIYIEAISPSLFIKLFGWILALPANALSSARIGEYTGIMGGNQQAAVFLNVGIAVHIANCYSNEKLDKKSIVYILFYLVAIVLTSKRMLTIIPIILFLIYYFMSTAKNKYIKFFLVAFVLFIVVYIGINLNPEYSDKILGYFSGEGEEDILSGRGSFWVGCIEMFLEKPINGYGLASFNGIYFEKTHYYFRGIPWIYHAHNIYYQMLAELGIIGFGLFLIQAMKVVPQMYKFNKKRLLYSKEQRQIMFWTMSIVVIFLLYGLTGNVLYNSEEICWYVVALNGIGYIVNENKKKCRKEIRK